jgi:hypothetical protein
MIALRGTYADECNGPLPDEELRYHCRVFPQRQLGGILWVNGVGEIVMVQDGDVLKVCGDGTWFAHYVNVNPLDVSADVAKFNAIITTNPPLPVT